jgi:hypothetical protein
MRAVGIVTLAGLLLGGAQAHAQTAPPPRKVRPAARPAARPAERTTEPRRDPPARPEARPGSAADDYGTDDAVPPLDTDPFRPPKADQKPPATARKNRPWFVRPSVLFVARFSRDRSFVPKEGFGFGIQAGATLGRSTLRLSLAVAYHFYRLARTMDIVVDDPSLTSCTAIRTLGYHLATGAVQALAAFPKVHLWAGLRGGYAHAQMKTPTSTCDTDDGTASTGVLGPELGFGYALRPDLHLGVSLAYLHYFSEKAYTSAEGTSHRYFYDMLTAGASLTLRF